MDIALPPRSAVSSLLHAHSDAGLCWHMRRNCALSPKQLLACYAVLCALSLAIGGLFAWIGFPVIVGFAAVELLAVGRRCGAMRAMCSMPRRSGWNMAT
jgi:uncharacterized membrane protein